MSFRRSVVINGDLGSGKSTVSVLLARRLGIRRISVGDLYREMAQRRGMTALQLNLHAELDDTIDGYVDQLQRDIAASGERLVVDSRLAWFFFTNALKVHIIADPAVAATRVLGRPGNAEERYASLAEALDRIASRAESERVRFLARYGADKTRLRNYDLVCDSTSATPAEIVDRIVTALDAPAGDVALAIDPKRIGLADGVSGSGPLRVSYDRPRFFALSGEHRVRAAVRADQSLIDATLAPAAEVRVQPAPPGALRSARR